MHRITTLCRYIIAATLCCCTALVSAKDNYPKNPDIDIVHYVFELSLTEQSDTITGKATVEILFRKQGTAQVRLDLRSLVEAGSMRGKGMMVDSIVLKNEPVQYRHANDVLWINCPPSAVSQKSAFIIYYHGIPATGLHIKPNKFGDKTFFSDNWPNLTRNWLPVIDHPYDKATCEFIVTAPERYAVVSNGLKLEESSIGNHLKRTHWKQSVPIASWLYVLGVAEFAVQYLDTFEGKSIETWVMRQERDSGFYVFSEPTKEALRFFSDYIGPFAYEKLANIQSNSVSGGMEAASAILYAQNSVSLASVHNWRHVVVHEIAHQWFGNAVTEADWDDVWLSEGFATYFTDMFVEHAAGKDAFINSLKQERKRVFQHHKSFPAYSVVHENLQDMSEVTSVQTYYKGAWILHMLRNRIGNSAFQQGIRNYYKKYFNSNATTSHFQYEMEQASGEDLSGFFHQWLVQKGNLLLNGTWQYASRTKEIIVTLQQVQPTEAYDIPVEIGIFNEKQGIPEIHTIRLTDKSAMQFHIPAGRQPQTVEIDPRVVLLSENTFTKK